MKNALIVNRFIFGYSSWPPSGASELLYHGQGHAQKLGDTPGLRDAAAGLVREITVEDFRHLSQPGLGQVGPEMIEPILGLLAAPLAARFHRGCKEGAHQPRPDRALVIGVVAAALIAF